MCAPASNVATWASNFTTNPDMLALVVKSNWGWSECLLVCTCDAIRKIEIIGEQK